MLCNSSGLLISVVLIIDRTALTSHTCLSTFLQLKPYLADLLEHFLAVKAGQHFFDFLVVELAVEAGPSLGGTQVEKSIPDVTQVHEVHRQVNIVVLAGEPLVQHLEQHLSGVLVGDVPVGGRRN